ncbi:unnamed protein product, partial [marine sediment metagenome]
HKFKELPEKDLLYLYNTASCLIFPSLYEGYGLPVVEAMACGCPVVCSDRTAIPESAGGAALLCGSDEEEWIKAIMKIINDDGQKIKFNNEYLIFFIAFWQLPQGYLP